MRSAKPWSNSWLPTELTSSPAALSASIVGLSFWMKDVNVEAPIMSPAAAKTVFGFSARICLTALESAAMPPDGAACSMRPWKSFTVTRSMSTVPGTPSLPTPTTIGSWSLERNGVPASAAGPQYSRPDHSGELIVQTAAFVTLSAAAGDAMTWSSEPSSPSNV